MIVTGAPFALVCLVAMGGFVRWLSASEEPLPADDTDRAPNRTSVPPATVAEDDD